METKQTELHADSMQLLFYQAPMSAAMLIVLFPLCEDTRALLAYDGGVADWIAIISSGVVAFLVNLSIFLVIGKTSPVTYNVLGHFKLCLILFGGFVLLHEPLTGLQAFGIALTLGGIFAYTYLKLNALPTVPLPSLPLPSLATSPAPLQPSQASSQSKDARRGPAAGADNSGGGSGARAGTVSGADMK